MPHAARNTVPAKAESIRKRIKDQRKRLPETTAHLA